MIMFENHEMKQRREVDELLLNDVVEMSRDKDMRTICVALQPVFQARAQQGSAVFLSDDNI